MKNNKISSLESWYMDGEYASFIRGNKVLFQIKINLCQNPTGTIQIGYSLIKGDLPKKVLGNRFESVFQQLANKIQKLPAADIQKLMVKKCRTCQQHVPTSSIRFLDICADCLKHYNQLTSKIKVHRQSDGEIVQLSFDHGYLKSFSHIAYDEIKLHDLSAKVVCYPNGETNSPGYLIHQELDEQHYSYSIDNETVVLFDVTGLGEPNDLFPFYDYMSMLFLKAKASS